MLFDQNPVGNQYMFRFNSLHKPFDNPKIREAALYALNQEDFLKAVIGDPQYYKTCAAMFGCGTTFATDRGGEFLLTSDFEKSKAMLQEAGYDGTPVVLMHSTDLQVLTNLAPVAKQLLEQGGFKVDMQSMDWQTLVARRAKKDPPSAGGWNAFMTNWVAADILDPISTAGLNAAGEKGWFGWFDDPKLEQMKRDFAEATDLDRQKELAAEIQNYALHTLVTHGYMGQWYQPMAVRKSLSGILQGPAPYFWNIEKQG
jgi:peptide/nickel transport system substrate-binding protein